MVEVGACTIREELEEGEESGLDIIILRAETQVEDLELVAVTLSQNAWIEQSGDENEGLLGKQGSYLLSRPANSEEEEEKEGVKSAITGLISLVPYLPVLWLGSTL